MKAVAVICSAYRPKRTLRGLFWPCGRVPGTASEANLVDLLHQPVESLDAEERFDIRVAESGLVLLRLS